MVRTAAQATLARDWSGLEELRRDLRAFLARKCADENELEDIIHETYLRAARYRTGSQPVRLRSWLLSIARNVLLDRRKYKERFSSLNDSEPELEWNGDHEEAGEPEERYQLGRWSLDREAATHHLSLALCNLREGDRRVLRSFYAGGEDSRATARDCAIPPHLVKIRLFRARKRLLKALRRHLALSFGVEPRVLGGSAR